MAWNPSLEVQVARDAATAMAQVKKVCVDRCVVFFTTADGRGGYASYGQPLCVGGRDVRGGDEVPDRQRLEPGDGHGDANVSLTKPEATLIARLLSDVADRYHNHGCNDLPAATIQLLSGAEWAGIGEAMRVWNEDPDDMDESDRVRFAHHDAFLMDFLAHRVRQAFELETKCYLPFAALALAHPDAADGIDRAYVRDAEELLCELLDAPDAAEQLRVWVAGRHTWRETMAAEWSERNQDRVGEWERRQP